MPLAHALIYNRSFGKGTQGSSSSVPCEEEQAASPWSEGTRPDVPADSTDSLT